MAGPIPGGPAIIVANHRSHADSAALIAALPVGQEVVFAAAADYWFARRSRRWLLQVAMPALALDRAGQSAYADMRCAAAPVLARGAVLVIYPEGSRGNGAELAAFKGGATRLAGDLGVPVIPVGIEGTQRVLPKSGRLHRHPVTVRFGPPLRGADLPPGPAALRDLVRDLLGQPVPAPVAASRLYRRVARSIDGPQAALLAACWGFAEAWSWPLLAEMSLVLFAVTVPRRLLRQALMLAAGSVAGVVTHAWLSAHGVALPLPLTTPAMLDAAAADLAGGPWGLVHQAFSGIPVKVYAAQAGAAGIDLLGLTAAAVVERGGRIIAVGLVLSGLAVAAQPLLRRWYPAYLVLVSLVFVTVLLRVVAAWS